MHKVLLHAEFANGPISGTHRVLAVLTTHHDEELACTIQDINEMLNGTKAFSLRNFYLNASYGKLNLEIETVGTYSLSSTCNNWTELKEEVLSRLIIDGINPQNYDHIIYFATSTGDCISNGSYSTPAHEFIALRKINNKCFAPLLHEFGHGLAFNHSTTKNDNYGDSSDIMGRHQISKFLNAPHAIESGWIPESQMKIIQSSGTYYLKPIEKAPRANTRTQIFRITREDHDIFISYRNNRGFKKRLSALESIEATKFINRISIHKVTYSNKPNFAFPRISSELLKTLANGHRYQAEDRSISIVQLSFNRRGAKIKIRLNNPTQ